MTTTSSLDSPTTWDVSNIYSSLEGDDYRAAVRQFQGQLQALESYFDEHGIRRLPQPPADLRQTAGVLGEVLQRVNDLLRLADTQEAFVYAFTSTNSYDNLAAREMSKLEQLDVQRRKLHVRLRGWIGSLDALLPELVAQDPLLEEHRFFLFDTARRSRYLMSEELEGLAADLSLDGPAAFGKLQGNVTSQVKVSFDRGQGTERLPITVVQNFRFHPDRALRQRAHQAEIAGWESVRTPVAACLNAVKGGALTLARRRGRPSVLDEALDQNRIDRPTLDALLGSIDECLPMFRRYLHSKAKKLGLPRLAWWDLFAPLDAAAGSYGWQEARAFIVEQFRRFDDELAEYAATAFDRRWIDGLPRDGKRGGAFCMGVLGVEESRILANFDGSFEQVSTLAHELGHGFHNHCQRGLPALRRGAPSTLAETASIFCETLVTEAVLANGAAEERLLVLESQLCGATQVCLDIRSRFLFESAVFRRRAESELSADDFCEEMRSAQAATYGDGVDPDTYHPYMWLWKPHYYSFEHNFYNFPYAFGHLFGLGLYALYRQEGPSFVPRYKALLRATGENFAAPLAEQFGIDIRRPDFWRGSLQVIEDQLRRYESL